MDKIHQAIEVLSLKLSLCIKISDPSVSKKMKQSLNSEKVNFDINLVAESSNRVVDLKANEWGIWYLESRPKENGRTTLIHGYKDDLTKDFTFVEITPSELSVRSSVHEYGGGSFSINGPEVYFVNSIDQQIYKTVINENHQISLPTTKITKINNSRFADIDINQNIGTLTAVMETHLKNKVTNKIVVASLKSNSKFLNFQIIEEESDFCSTPRFCPNGKHISYLTWNHPNMPWDSSNWIVAKLKTDSDICSVVKKTELKSAYQTQNFAVVNPYFITDNTLVALSDSKNGFLNPVVADLKSGVFENLISKKNDFGWPHWVFGRNMLTVIGDGPELLGAFFNFEQWKLCKIKFNQVTEIESELRSISTICSNKNMFKMINNDYKISRNKAQFNTYALGSTNNATSVILEISGCENKRSEYSTKLKSLSLPNIKILSRTFFSNSEAINIKDKKLGDLHFIFHKPTMASNINSDFKPVIIQMHGGPTSMVDTGCNLTTAFFNSKSIGIADLNYRGSSGYGRKYMQSLYGKWGVFDTQDAYRTAEYLVENNLANPDQIFIRGSSAGGYSVLMTITQYDFFAGATSYYGIADLKMLVKDTHKFESKYLEHLIGNLYNSPELYDQRSPISHISNIRTPLLIFQGDLDPIVPKNQAELIYSSLKKNKVKTKLIIFENESHGFRKSESIKKSLSTELKFYGEILNTKIL